MKDTEKQYNKSKTNERQAKEKRVKVVANINHLLYHFKLDCELKIKWPHLSKRLHNKCEYKLYVIVNGSTAVASKNC